MGNLECTPNLVPADPQQVVYDWETVDFPDCPTVCGITAFAQLREVKCMGDDGSMGEDHYCDSATLPEDERICEDTDPCVVYGWEIVQDYMTPCPSDCGLSGSTQSRMVLCLGDDGSQGLEGVNCDANLKPETERSCPATANCPCDPSPCLNGSTCSETGLMAVCTCVGLFEGQYCETPVSIDCPVSIDVLHAS
eukprot:UN23470